MAMRGDADRLLFEPSAQLDATVTERGCPVNGRAELVRDALEGSGLKLTRQNAHTFRPELFKRCHPGGFRIGKKHWCPTQPSRLAQRIELRSRNLGPREHHNTCERVMPQHVVF